VWDLRIPLSLKWNFDVHSKRSSALRKLETSLSLFAPHPPSSLVYTRTALVANNVRDWIGEIEGVLLARPGINFA
jgi:hypothetical protein